LNAAVTPAESSYAAFNVAAGGSVCEDCRPAGSTRPQRGSVRLMIALLSGDWPRAEASSADDRRDPVVQLAPPLICDQEHFDEMEQILRSVLTEAWSRI